MKVNCVSSLEEYLRTHPHRGFSRKPHRYGDYLTFFTSEDRVHAVTVNKKVTLYLSLEDDSLVGFKVYSPRNHKM